MGEHDLPHVVSPKAKWLDLRQRRHVGPRPADGHRSGEQRAKSATVAHVVDAEARVDED